jgi:hypothetical protein
MKDDISLILFVGGIVAFTMWIMGKSGGSNRRGTGRSTLAAGAYGAPQASGQPSRQAHASTVPGVPARRNGLARAN